jgi:hypothetical protein
MTTVNMAWTMYLTFHSAMNALSRHGTEAQSSAS